MAEKRILQGFEQFIGLDLKSTDLVRGPTALKGCTNTRFGEGRSLRKREGYQLIGMPGGFTRIFTHSYSDSQSGATIQELLGINQFLWKLKASSLTVSSGTDINYSMALNTSSATYRLVLRSGSTAYTFSGNPYIDLGTGLTGSPTTIESLRSTIDAHATLVCSRPSLEFAVVNGNQTNVTTVNVLDSPHTYAIGDWIYFPHSVDGEPDRSLLAARKISAVTSTSITFDSAVWDTVSVVDGQILGPLATPAASIFIKDASDSASNPTSVSIEFYYWDLVPPTTHHYYNNDGEPFRENFYSKSTSTYIFPCFVNSNQNAYIYTRASIEPTNAGTNRAYTDYPFKYDGQNVYREGMPQANAPTLAVGAAGSLTGTYKYRAAFVNVDKRGNEIIGRVSDEASIDLTSDRTNITVTNFVHDTSTGARSATVNGDQAAVTTITVTAGHSIRPLDYAFFYDRDPSPDALIIRQIASVTTTSVTVTGAVVSVTNGDVIYLVKNLGFNTKGAIVNGNQSDVVTITVENTTGRPNHFDIGDKIFFLDGATGSYVTRTLTGKTATTITFSSSEGRVNVTDDEVISCIRVRLYRTKAGGSIFYELLDIPFDYSNLTTTYTDNAADTTLRVRFIEPEIGLEQDLPPKAAIATTHQGTRVCSAIKGEPNTVAVYDIQNVEGISLASQYFDIPSSIPSNISAIASDTEGSLAIFKPNAYYSVNGDLVSGAFSITPEMEGDYGISSQASIVKIRGATFGIGLLGVITLKNREISYLVGTLINPVLQNNPSINLSKSIAVNDWSKRGYHFFVPSINGFGAGTAITGYKSFFFDYENGAWFEDAWTGGIEPSGGMDIFLDTEFILAQAFGLSGTATSPGQVYRALKITSTMATPAALYADNQLAISRTISFLHTMETPSIDKEFLRLKIFSLYNVGESDQFVASSPTIRTYRNFQSSTLDTSSSMSFTSSSIFEDSVKLRSNKARAMQFDIIDNAISECLHLSGWEILVALPYKSEDIEP